MDARKAGKYTLMNDGLDLEGGGGSFGKFGNSPIGKGKFVKKETGLGFDQSKAKNSIFRKNKKGFVQQGGAAQNNLGEHYKRK